jgi:hypothetical protein
MTTSRSLLAILAIVGGIALASGCSKDEPPAPAAPPPGPSAVVSAVPSVVASSPPVADAAPVAPPASAVPSTSSSAKGAPTCGDKPLPPCPLQGWMKANTSPAMTAQDFGALATALEKIVTFAPAGYTNWVSISRDGADAARAQTLDGVKAACRGCHNQYKDRYRKEMRDRPIVP